MPGPAPLKLQDVTVRYGTATALDALALEVARGEIVALLGPNGSGKSTALAVAAGLLDPASGCVRVEGITRRDHPHQYAARIGYVPQDVALYEELTASRNLAFFGQLLGLRGRTLEAAVIRGLRRARLTERARECVHSFSGGLKQRLSIAVALLHEPAVLLLDEPTTALDAASRDALIADLHHLRDDGHAILLSTHDTDLARRCCRVHDLGTPRQHIAVEAWRTPYGPVKRTVFDAVLPSPFSTSQII